MHCMHGLRTKTQHSFTNSRQPCIKLKDLTRGKGGINKDSLRAFIQTLNIPADEKKRLSELSPETYTGKAGELAKKI